MMILQQGLTVLIVTTCIELSLYNKKVWEARFWLSPIIIIGTAFGSMLVVTDTPRLGYILAAIIGLYRIINVLRIPERRMHEQHLRTAFVQSSIWLILLQLLAISIQYSTSLDLLHTSYTWVVLSIVQACFALFILSVAGHNIRKYRPRPSRNHYSAKELPTVTIAIPARNETDDLDECLKSLVENDYPKLEILVLDDCSQDKTPDIIRSFAHDGVRFVRGDEPSNHWLPKNQAYEKLYKEASGDMILFCGVDTRFSPHAVYNMVEIMLEHDLKMISMLPQRPKIQPIAQLIQPMRYWWEIAFPRRWMRQPACLSTCWIINRETLRHLGGFDGVSRDIRPECYFAREISKTKKYVFMISNTHIGVSTLKRASEQYATAIRVRYPEVHKKPERVFILSLIEIVFLVLPVCSLLYGISTHDTLAVFFAMIAIILLILTHVRVLGASNPSSKWIAIVSFPLVALVELLLVNESMRRYEFGTVNWRGRNVCTPVMHVYPKLPKLPARVIQD